MCRLGQHRAGPAWAAQRGGELFFSPPTRLLHATCRRRKMQTKKRKEKAGGGGVPGVEEAVDGGAAVAWLVDGGSGRRRCGCSVCSLSLFPSPCFGSVFLFFFFFCFRFWFQYSLLSLSCVLYLSSVSSLSLCFFKKKSVPLLSPSVSPFIAKKTE